MMTVDECPVMSISAANNRFKDSSWQKHDFLSFHCQLQRHYSNTAPSYHQFNYRRHIRKRFRQKINYNENSSGSEPVEEVDKKSCGFTLAMGDEHDDTMTSTHIIFNSFEHQANYLKCLVKVLNGK